MAFNWNQFWSSVDAHKNGGGESAPAPEQPKSFYSMARSSRKEDTPGVMPAPKQQGLSSDEMASQSKIFSHRGPGPGGL